MNIEQGCTRIVFLTRNYAIKIPNFTYSLDHFLKGWIANIQECKIWYIYNLDTIEDKTIKYKICPILKSYLWKFIIIMPKCLKVKKEDFPENNPLKHIYGDHKIDNYGIYQNRLVCLDYGQ